jgi:hypothetical protein
MTFGFWYVHGFLVLSERIPRSANQPDPLAPNSTSSTYDNVRGVRRMALIETYEAEWDFIAAKKICVLPYV